MVHFTHLALETEKEDFLENLHVLSCCVQLKSVLLICCVFWILKLPEKLFDDREYFRQCKSTGRSAPSNLLPRQAERAQSGQAIRV